MHKKFLLGISLCAGLTTTIQAKTGDTDSIHSRNKSLYLELFGPSNLIGISYDSRFTARTAWGYRIGVSYFYGESSSMFSSSSSHIIFCPVEVNYLIGKKKHKLEIGTGINLGMSRENANYFDIEKDEMVTEVQRNFAYFFYSNIGYRFQADNGFQLRIGVNPTFSPEWEHVAKRKPAVLPYVSLGYSF